MRVSTSQIYDTGINGITRNQASMLKTQTQITTGRRVLTPSDDPVASARALVVTQSQQLNQRYLENQKQAGEQLAFTESTLGSVTKLIQNVLDTTIQAGNTGTVDDAGRKILARELRSRYDELAALANTQDGEGNYIFAGFNTATRPFPTAAISSDAAGAPISSVNYAGDDGKRALQVESSRVMPINETGSDVFVRIRDKNGNLTNENVFESLGNFITALETTPFDAAAFKATYNTSLGNFNAALDNTLRLRTAAGSRMAELESMKTTAGDRDLQYESTLSDLQDLDYADALSSLSKQQLILDAAQKSFMAMTQLGLFNKL